MTKFIRVLYSRAAIARLGVAKSRHLSSLADSLKCKERVEERRFVCRQEKDQLADIRRKHEETMRLRKQLYDEVRLENAVADIMYLLGPEKISHEAMKRLAAWKEGL